MVYAVLAALFLLCLHGSVLARPSLPVDVKVYNDDCSVPAFRQFQKDFGKKSTRDDEKRRQRLCDAIKVNQAHNEDESTTFLRGINIMSDFSAQEFETQQDFFYVDRAKFGIEAVEAAEEIALPETFDWRKDGIVGPVENQGVCGSSWALAASGAIEAALQMRQNSTRVSDQHIINCSVGGCKGGNAAAAFTFVQENRVALEDDYPYLASKGMCSRSAGRGERSMTISGAQWVKEGDEEALKRALATVGPVVVAIDASLDSFKNYQSGVYFDSACRANLVTHSLLLVGYGNDEAAGDYWIVRNSWGTGWGEGGYARVARNRNNHCGIASSAVYPVLL